MRSATVFTLAAAALAVATLSACHVRIPPKYDNKPVASAAAPVHPEAAK